MQSVASPSIYDLHDHIDGLVQDCSNSSASAMESLQYMLVLLGRMDGDG